MLHTLTIYHVRLIEKLDLEFSKGFSVLSGETGAGKSILLEALGLALGERAEEGLIRKEAPRASVTATFLLSPDHAAWAFLKEQGLEADLEGLLVLRRVVSREGPLSRAFINDQGVSLAFLRQIAETVVDIHGQFDSFLLRAPKTALMDQYGKLEAIRKSVAKAHALWKTRKAALEALQSQQKKAEHERTFLLHCFEELQDLNPMPGEEETLLEQRSALIHQEKLLENLHGAETHLSGVSSSLAQAGRLLEKAIPFCRGGGLLIQETLRRLFADLDELDRLLKDILQEREVPSSLEAVDDRLFKLRAFARKHNISLQGLSHFQETVRSQLDLCGQGDDLQKELEGEVEGLKKDYLEKAENLHQKRLQAARLLEERVARECRALKLEKASFQVRSMALSEKAYGPEGTHAFEFCAATNPGEPPGPLGRVASGGELSRFLLALKVAMAGHTSVSTLIFDEIDSGTGGAVAEAIGLRLRALSQHVQILVITHSPQVAAQGDHHWKVSKEVSPQGLVTRVTSLSKDQHLEEIARMLSGAAITQEARAAALQLKGARL